MTSPEPTSSGKFGNFYSGQQGARRMPSTVEILVSAHVRLKNRRALESMRELRRELLQYMHCASVDPRHAQQHVYDDLQVIEAGLEQLRSFDASMDEDL
jgi:hypothetical protein